MKILKKLFGGDTKIHVDEVADSAGKLLSGLTIVEADSSGLGSWVKFGDGTMVIFRTFTNNLTPNQALSSGFRSSEYTAPFPKSFVELPTVIASVNYTGRYASVSSVGVSSCNLIMIALASTTVTADMSYVAFGRWKA